MFLKTARLFALQFLFNASFQVKKYTACCFLSHIYYLRRMEELLQQIEQHKKEIESFVGDNGEAAESFRIKYLGTKGIVKNIMQEMKNVPNDKKKEAGQLLNEI